jgi:dolichol-phosphate mannosyltransferase
MLCLRSFVGFRQTGLAYERAARQAGQPKYTLRALVALAIDGLVSFSSYPLRLVTLLGLCVVGLASLLAVWVLRTRTRNGPLPGVGPA